MRHMHGKVSVQLGFLSRQLLPSSIIDIYCEKVLQEFKAAIAAVWNLFLVVLLGLQLWGCSRVCIFPVIVYVFVLFVHC